jgi:hypothetical protein
VSKREGRTRAHPSAARDLSTHAWRLPRQQLARARSPGPRPHGVPGSGERGAKRDRRRVLRRALSFASIRVVRCTRAAYTARQARRAGGMSLVAATSAAAAGGVSLLRPRVWCSAGAASTPPSTQPAPAPKARAKGSAPASGSAERSKSAPARRVDALTPPADACRAAFVPHFFAPTARRRKSAGPQAASLRDIRGDRRTLLGACTARASPALAPQATDVLSSASTHADPLASAPGS